MNYFAHGRQFVNQPYFMAGTSVPDWLPVLNRRVKALPAGARGLRPELESKILCRKKILQPDKDGLPRDT